ncbi:MAG TPA: hypothetical protein VEQ60_31960 [Longimicrobium sp.]|nr:hypothetical protein [Longimicrobium sp.]
MMDVLEVVGGVFFWGALLLCFMLILVAPFVALYAILFALSKLAGRIRREPVRARRE